MPELWSTSDLPGLLWDDDEPPDDDGEPNTITITVPEEYL